MIVSLLKYGLKWMAIIIFNIYKLNQGEFKMMEEKS